MRTHVFVSDRLVQEEAAQSFAISCQSGGMFWFMVKLEARMSWKPGFEN
jgi:hypothetical protein